MDETTREGVVDRERRVEDESGRSAACIYIYTTTTSWCVYVYIYILYAQGKRETASREI